MSDLTGYETTKSETERLAILFRKRWQTLESLIETYINKQRSLPEDEREEVITALCMVQNTLPRVEEMTAESFARREEIDNPQYPPGHPLDGVPSGR